MAASLREFPFHWNQNVFCYTNGNDADPGFVRKIFCIKEISPFPWGNCLPHYVDQNFYSEKWVINSYYMGGSRIPQDQEAPVADLGFSRRGRWTLEFGAKTYYLARFLLKTAWKWKKWTDRGAMDTRIPCRLLHHVRLLNGFFFSVGSIGIVIATHSWT